MLDVEAVLGSLVSGLSEDNYERSLAHYRLWFELGQTYSQIPSDLVFNTIWNHKDSLNSSNVLISPTSHLILRFVNYAESDQILAPHSAGLLSRLCTSILQEFFKADVRITHQSSGYSHATYVVLVNLLAHCANLGYIEETTIRNHILQSLISHPDLRFHHANALIILFKIAGATFGAYTDQLVIDRCFDRLKGYDPRSPMQKGLINVRGLCQGSVADTKIKF